MNSLGGDYSPNQSAADSATCVSSSDSPGSSNSAICFQPLNAAITRPLGEQPLTPSGLNKSPPAPAVSSNSSDLDLTFIDDTPIGREPIMGIENFLRAAVDAGEISDTVNDQPLEHDFITGLPGGNLYARQMILLKDNLIVGKIHRYPCFNFIMSGRCQVYSEDGIKHVVAPYFFKSLPGAKRAVYAEEETVWVTVHSTTKTDLKEVEAELIAPSYAALEDHS